jgi:Holliday junction DNA helicase RuvA
MIVRLSGVIEAIDGTRAVVAAPGGTGLAYEVLLPAYLSRRLQEAGAVGREVTLHTLEYLEGQGQGTSFVPRLIGFATARERAFFELFTTVKGLGNRRALRALAAEPGEIAAAIASRDSRRLKQLPEIGPRLAETIVAELKGKADSFAEFGTGVAAGAIEAKDGVSLPPLPAAEEAVGALVALGESRQEAERKVSRAMARSPGLAETGQIIQAALAGR